MTSPPLETRLKDHARSLGFDLVGIAPAAPADGFDRLQSWLDRGFAGEMHYLHKHADARRHPESVLPNVRSVVMVGMTYSVGEKVPGGDQVRGSRDRAPGEDTGAQGRSDLPLPVTESPESRPAAARVARYAHGADYHDVLRERLNQLLGWLQAEAPGCLGRGVVDTAPLLERDFARRAGLGWFGKNTMLINKRLGSFLFLGALLVDIELQPDRPHEMSHCGNCTACLDACPTDAFSGPGWLDARKCISYLTIELKGPVPADLRPQVGEWLFGCDVCQEVCPWNRKRSPGDARFPHDPDLVALDPVELLGLSAEQFCERFRATALNRTKRRGLLRNAAIVLGNRGDAAALPALVRALHDQEPLVREAAGWAIGRIEAARRRAGSGVADVDADCRPEDLDEHREVGDVGGR